MRPFKAWIFSAASLWLSACASIGGYDMKSVQAELAQTVQTTEAVVQKAKSDYREKSTLVNSLKKAGDPKFKEAEPEITKRLGLMNISLDKMSARYKTMRDANASLASLGYSHPRIASDDPKYPKVSESVADFQQATKDVNAAVLDYSRESNSLADEVSKRKLYANYDVADFQKRLAAAIKTSQNNQSAMTKDIERAQGVVNNWNRQESRQGHADTLADMVASAQEYSTKAQGLSKFSRAMNDAANGLAKISTMDPAWPQAQEAIEEMDQIVASLKEIFAKFQSDLERFRKPAKAN